MRVELPPMLEYVTHSQQNSPAKRKHLEALCREAMRRMQEACARECDLEFAACWHADAISQANEAKKCAAAIRKLEIK